MKRDNDVFHAVEKTKYTFPYQEIVGIFSVQSSVLVLL